MKLNSTKIRGATILALIAGLSPALIAQSGGSSTYDQQTIPGDTDRDSRARDRNDSQRPGHNSNRTPGQGQSSASTPREGSAHTTQTRSERDVRMLDRPGHNSDTPGAGGVGAAGVVYTEDHLAREQEASRYSGQTGDDSGMKLRKGSANELTGMKVTNRSGENLGRIKDFVIDTQSGQVVYAVVGSGGVAGIGEKLHAVPVQALNHNAAGDSESLTLDVDSERWAQAPRFSKDRLSSLQQDQEGRSLHEFYGQTWRPDSRVSMNNPVRNQGAQAGTTASRQESARGLDMQGQRLALASSLIGKNIRSGTETIGEIEDVIVQLQSGSAAALLDPDNDFAGSDQKYIVPLNRFTIAGNNALTATLQRSDFSSARQAEGDSWATAQSDSLFVWQDSRSSRLGDSAQVTSPRLDGRQLGTPPIAEVRRAIQSDASIAANQSDIQVEAQGDKLVLRGTVLNKDTKDKIEDRAEKAAPGWNIDNQLSVATTTDMSE